jgi:hypothetical protein
MCGCTETRILLRRQYLISGKLLIRKVCAGCGRFLGWQRISPDLQLSEIPIFRDQQLDMFR